MQDNDRLGKSPSTGAAARFTVKRNSGWNQNIKWDWLVIDVGGCVRFGSDLASECEAIAETLNKRGAQ